MKWFAGLFFGLSSFYGLTGEAPKPVPKPGTERMMAPIRKKIEAFHAEVERIGQSAKVPVEQKARAFGRLGELYHAHDLFDAATVAYQNAHILQPSEVRWSYFLGLLHHGKGEMEKAVGRFRQALALKPNDLVITVRLATALLELNQLEEATEQFRTALVEDPLNPVTHFGLAKVYAAQEDHYSAIRHFEKALQTRPDATVIHYPLALAYRGVGNLDRARFHLDRRGEGKLDFPDPFLRELNHIITTSAVDILLEMAPDPSLDLQTFTDFGLYYLRERKGVVSFLADRADKEKASSPMKAARLNLMVGLLYGDQGENDIAVARFRACLGIQPNMAFAKFHLAQLLNLAGNNAEALQLTSEMLADHPLMKRNTHLRAKLFLASDQMTDWQKAEQLLTRHLEIHGDDRQAKFLMAASQQKLGRLEAAMATYDSLLDVSTPIVEEVSILKVLSRLARDRRDAAGALEYCERLLELEPDNGAAIIDSAALLASLERYDEAASRYADAVLLEPRNPLPLQGQVAALLFQKEEARALALLEKAILDFPNENQFVETLTRLLAAAADVELRDGERALQLAQKNLARANSLVNSEAMAMALAQLGRFEDAAVIQRSLIAIAKRASKVNPQLIDRLETNLVRYEDEQSCCATASAHLLSH